MFAALPDWIAAAPVAFLLGVLVGLGLASRYRIVRLRDDDASRDQRR